MQPPVHPILENSTHPRPDLFVVSGEEEDLVERARDLLRQRLPRLVRHERRPTQPLPTPPEQLVLVADLVLAAATGNCPALWK